MAISDIRILPGDYVGKDVSSAPDRLTGSAQENKAVFDRIIKDMIAGKINAIIDELTGANGAGNIGTRFGKTLISAILSDDISSMRLNADGAIETSRDGATWEMTASSGHIILDREGRELIQRSRMRFLNSVVSDENGVTTVYGIKGDKGETGDKGERGETGLQGERGEKGKTGTAVIPAVSTQGTLSWQFTDEPVLPSPVSIRGPQGTQGIQGEQGARGAQGGQGIQGMQGLQGVRGSSGDVGEKGESGTQGTQGIQGVQGPIGARGIQGEKGAQGAIGAQGAMGAQGLRGESGVDGRSFVIQDVYATLGELKIAIPNGNEFAYQVSFDKNIYIWSELESTWIALGQLQGPKGEQGLQGVAGPHGEQGLQGETGPTGAQGTQGVQGKQGVQGANGERGEKGETGAQGPLGPQGAEGPQGVPGIQGMQGTNGKSAFSSAVSGGYTGTETAFNADLADIGEKATRKIPSSAGNIATLDASGNLADSGKKAADFEAAGEVNSAVSAHNSSTNPHSGILATTKTYMATLTTAGWSTSAPFTQTVSVSGILAADNPTADVVLSATAATAKAQLEAWGTVGRITTAANSITAYCYDEKPTTAIPIQIKAVR